MKRGRSEPAPFCRRERQPSLPPSTLQSGVSRDGRPMARNCVRRHAERLGDVVDLAHHRCGSPPAPSSWTSLMKTVPVACRFSFSVTGPSGVSSGVVGQRGVELGLAVRQVAADLVQRRRSRRASRRSSPRRRATASGSARLPGRRPDRPSHRPARPDRGCPRRADRRSACRRARPSRGPCEVSTVWSAMMVPPIRLVSAPACWYWLRKLIASVPPTPR